MQPSTSQQITRTLCEDSTAVLWLSLQDRGISVTVRMTGRLAASLNLSIKQLLVQDCVHGEVSSVFHFLSGDEIIGASFMLT